MTDRKRRSSNYVEEVVVDSSSDSSLDLDDLTRYQVSTLRENTPTRVLNSNNSNPSNNKTNNRTMQHRKRQAMHFDVEENTAFENPIPSTSAQVHRREWHSETPQPSPPADVLIPEEDWLYQNTLLSPIEPHVSLADFEDEPSSEDHPGRGDGMSYIKLKNIHNTFNRRFHIESKIYEFNFMRYNGDIPFETFVIEGFNEMIGKVTADAQPDDLIGIKIEVRDSSAKPIGLNYRPVNTLSGEMVLDLLNSVAQSNAVFSITDRLIISATLIALPYGGAINLAHCTDRQVLQRKNSVIIHIGVRGDNLCLPKAILLGKAWVDANFDLMRAYQNPANESMFTAVALKFTQRAKVNVRSIGCNMFCIYKFQRLLPDYTITVYDEKKNSGNQHFCRSGTGAKKINLFYLKELKHFVALKDRGVFFGRAFECEICGFLYQRLNSHLCKVRCTQCRGKSVCKTTSEQTCKKCSRVFRNEKCFATHLAQICANVFYCKRCEKIIELIHRKNKVHTCHETFCKLCYTHVPEDHGCYVKPYTKNLQSKYTIVFYDLECMQDVNEIGVRKHVPNLIVSMQVCEQCADRAIVGEQYYCSKCLNNKLAWYWSLEDGTCVRKFLNYLDTFKTPVTAICHNFRGYDSHFLLEELSKRSSPIELVMNGWKTMYLQYRTIRFVDSFNYMTMPLSAIPKSFGLGDIAKGFYPHKMNSVQYQNYAGRIPPKEMYDIQNFSLEQYKRFEQWYETQANIRFVNVEQLLDYCILDVMILKRGALKFMKLFTELLHLNPLLEAVTLPSSLMLAFRKTYLKPNSLGILPRNEYAGNKKQSIIGRKWLEYENRKVHYRLIFEYKLPNVGVYVDGYLPVLYPQTKPVVYEIFGCHWHMCPHCYASRPNLYKPSMYVKKESVDLRVERIKAAGYDVIVEWECKFKQFLKENPSINDTLSNSTFLQHSPLKCRDAIFGGVVDVFRTYYKCRPGEKIVALDFKSLYPYTNKYGCYPLGHPRIYHGPIDCSRCALDEIYGIIKCRIVPPRKLFHPVLPIRHNDRLMLGLCMSCMEQAIIDGPQYTQCSHNDMERSILGTWVIGEVNLAISKGYRIIERIEIWEYDVDKIDINTRVGGVFTEYVNTFLKIKEQASGYPRENMTQAEKEEYIERFFLMEGIRLDPEEMVYNEALRNLGKISLNCLWGKFGENPDFRSSTTVFTDPSKFFEHLTRPDISVLDILCWGDQGVYVNWRSNDNSQTEPLKHGVVPIGAFTTAYGRMCLYSVLDTLHSSDLEANVALYCDTDSIFYIMRSNQNFNLPLGDGLGQLTNMLATYGSNSYITEFVATGPKAYGYKIFNPDNNSITEVCKCKGIASTVKNTKKLNFKNLRRTVQNYENLTFTNESKIKRKKPFSIVTEVETKKIRCTYNKRAVRRDGLTIPFGY